MSSGKSKAKKKIQKIKLVDPDGNSKYFYTTTKNVKNITEKMKFRKYAPDLRKYIVFVEKSINK